MGRPPCRLFMLAPSRVRADDGDPLLFRDLVNHLELLRMRFPEGVHSVALDGGSTTGQVDGELDCLVDGPMLRGQHAREHLARIQRDTDAAGRYVMRPYDGATTLILTLDDLEAIPMSRLTGNVERLVVPGTHEALLSRSHVRELVKILGQHLSSGST
jgi:hypothetical protein